MKQDIREATSFIRTNKKVLGIVAFLFVGLGIWAYFQYIESSEYAKLFDSLIKEALGGLGGEEGFALAVSIFLNNIKASVYGVIMGIIPFIFVPGISIATNGMLTGAAVAAASVATGESGLKLLCLGILPHGIFELPALLISITLGIVLCRELTRTLLRKPHMKLNQVLEKIAKTYVLLVLPLLVVAALVESFITPMLL